MSVRGLILYFTPYLRSMMVRFALVTLDKFVSWNREHLMFMFMFLIEDPLKKTCFINWDLSWFKFCHNLSFWVLSQLEFLSFVTIWVFTFWVYEFCHNLSFVTIWVFFTTWVESPFEFLSIITIWVFWVSSKLELLSFITILVSNFITILLF